MLVPLRHVMQLGFYFLACFHNATIFKLHSHGFLNVAVFFLPLSSELKQYLLLSMLPVIKFNFFGHFIFFFYETKKLKKHIDS